MKGKLFLERAVNSAIRVILTGIIFLLFLHSIFSTSFLGEIMREDGTMQTRTLNIPDQPLVHLAVFIVVSVIGLAGCRAVCGRPEKGKGRILPVLSAVFTAAGIVWILLTQLKPGSDPAKVYAVAMEWRSGDFSAFEEGNYLFCYPFQSGIVLFYYLLSFLFGVEHYIGPQIVNVLSLAVVYYLLSLMARSFWQEDRKLPAFVYGALMCWVPIFFYVTYIYGILPGMACSVGMLYLTLRYLETGRYRYMAGAALCIGAATVLKMNCLIYLVAAACFLLYDAVILFVSQRTEGEMTSVSYPGAAGRKWTVSILFVLLMAVSVWGCGQITTKFVEHLSGYEMPEGEVMISWVVMGMQEAPRGPGNYNGYNGDVFIRNNYDTELAKKQSVEDLRKIIRRMAENPLDEGVTFFARKTAYQWNDPTFISIDRMRGRKSAIEISEPVRSLIDGRGSVALSVLLNYMQTLLLSGMLLYLILNWQSRNLYELMGAVVFLGGYLFHMVWESSASYTIPYFVLMIPYAVKGFGDWFRVLDRMAGKRGIWAKRGRLWFPALGIAVVMLLLLCFGRTNLFHNTIALNDGEDAIEQFYHQGDAKPYE